MRHFNQSYSKYLIKTMGIHLILVLTLITPKPSYTQCNNADEYTALRALYLSTDGDNWYTNTGWPDAASFIANTTPPAGTDMGSWSKVTCASSTIIHLDLEGNNLNGNIPAEIGLLANLETLSFEETQLSGNIPVEIGLLTNLKELRLADNQLSGNIPTEIGMLANLESLYLSVNELSGNIPAQIGNLSNLKNLSISSNNLSGNIPAEIGMLANLKSLYLSGNQISGNIPAQIGNLSNLECLILSGNQLSGNIPTQIGNLTNLESLFLSSNQLSGSIPTQIGNLSNLKILYLSDNKLSGNIPTEIGNLSNLESLVLYDNELSGCWPSSFNSFCSQLTHHRFRDNNYNGTTDFISDQGFDDFCNSSVGSCTIVCHPDETALMDLYTTTSGANWVNNSGWGTCDPCTGNAGNPWYGLTCANIDGQMRVTEISLVENKLIGDWSSVNLSPLTELTKLHLHNTFPGGANDNDLTGGLPTSANALSTLAYLNLSRNLNLGSSLPADIGIYLPNMVDLRFWNCNLTGEIPQSIGDMVDLEWLSLDNNNLTGSIPSSFGYLTMLNVLWLKDNDLSGCYDPSLSSSMCSFTNSHISDGNMFLNPWEDFCNNGDGTCTSCTHPDYNALMDLYNNTNGASWTNNTNWGMGCPCDPSTPWLGVNCSGGRVRTLILPNNNLNGSLPTSVGELSSLEVLNLSTNLNLGGSIPATIGQLQALRQLQIFSCGLSGSLPQELTSLPALTDIRLSHNMLSGAIPEIQVGEFPIWQTLYLNNNNLSGNIPNSIGDASFLTHLWLWSNDLTGTIPSTIGSLYDLQQIRLGGNLLDGSIPNSIGNLQNLTTLWLENNGDGVVSDGLTGTIPWQLTNCSNLISVRFMNNDLSGCYDTRLQHMDAQLGSTGSHGFVSSGNQLDNWDTFVADGTGTCCYDKLHILGVDTGNGFNLYPGFYVLENDGEITPGLYQSTTKTYLTNYHKVATGSNVIANGGESVTLFEEFEVEAGATFEALTDGCVEN